MAKTFILNITQEDIDKASEQRSSTTYKVCYDCVVAIALTRQLGKPCRAFCHIGDVGHSVGAIKDIKFPKKLQEYIRDFDNHDPIKPAKFRLTFA